MRTRLPLVLLAWTVTSATHPAAALERRAMRWSGEDRPDAWTGSASCTVTYYNYCNGWIWIVGDLRYKDVGMLVETCCDAGATLTNTWQYVYTGVHGGYAARASIHLSAVDAAGCPVEPPLASMPYEPRIGWNLIAWNVQVPSRFAIHTYIPNHYWIYRLELATDHPGSVAGGPPACGSCYPVTRGNHSYYFMVDNQALCPPEPLLPDGDCFAELIWDHSFLCPVNVEPHGWARVKAMYR